MNEETDVDVDKDEEEEMQEIQKVTDISEKKTPLKKETSMSLSRKKSDTEKILKDSMNQGSFMSII